MSLCMQALPALAGRQAFKSLQAPYLVPSIPILGGIGGWTVFTTVNFVFQFLTSNGFRLLTDEEDFQRMQRSLAAEGRGRKTALRQLPLTTRCSFK